jgi:hypothetical protein
MKIDIQTIDQKHHRYPTVGDYWYGADGTLHVRVSKMGVRRYEQLVIIHELIEVFLTEAEGIPEPKIMEFDVAFEKEREEGKHAEDAEPGFDPRAPYAKEHLAATGVEMLLAALLKVKWSDYEKTIYAL